MDETTNQRENSINQRLEGKNGSLKVTPIVSNGQARNATTATLTMLNGNDGFTHHVTGYRNNIISDLIPYPSSSISTIIEKVGEEKAQYRYVNTDDIVKKKPIKQTFQSFTLEEDKEENDNEEQRGAILQLQSSPSRNDEKLVKEHTSQAIVFDDYDVARIVKYLKAKKNCSTQTEVKEYSTQYSQVNFISNPEDPNIFELQRSNQALRSQLEQLSYIIEEMSKERSSNNLQLHYLQKQISVKDLSIEEVRTEKEKLAADNDEIRFALRNAENVAAECRRNMTTIKSENDNLRAQMCDVEQLRNEMNLKEQQMREMHKLLELSQQDNVVLKHQLTHLTTQLQCGRPGQWSSARQRIQMVKSQCDNLKNSLNSLRHTSLVILGAFKQELNQEVLTLFRTIRSQILSGASSELQAEIEDLRKSNEQLLKDKLHEKNRNIELNFEFQSYLGFIRNENENLKRLNENLSSSHQTAKMEQERLTEQHQKAIGELEQCRATIELLQLELGETRRESSSNQVASAEQQATLEENVTLRETIVRLEENCCALKSKLTEALTNANLNAVQYEKDLTQKQKSLEDLVRQCEEEKVAKETLQREISSIKADLSTKKEKIQNLEANIQRLTKKYREFVLQKRDFAEKLTDRYVQTDADDNTREEVSNGEELQIVKSEMESKLSDLRKVIALKDDEIKTLQQTVVNDNEDVIKFNQQILNLENALLKEKERSKGLSQSLFDEKRTVIRIKDELVRLKQSVSGDSGLASQETPTSIGQGEDIELVKFELAQRIKQLKQLLLHTRLHHSGTTSSAESEHSSTVTQDPSGSMQDFIIQILDQTEEVEQALPLPRPLGRIHSSLEELRKEFHHLKQNILDSNTSPNESYLTQESST